MVSDRECLETRNRELQVPMAPTPRCLSGRQSLRCAPRPYKRFAQHRPTAQSRRSLWSPSAVILGGNSGGVQAGLQVLSNASVSLAPLPTNGCQARCVRSVHQRCQLPYSARFLLLLRVAMARHNGTGTTIYRISLFALVPLRPSLFALEAEDRSFLVACLQRSNAPWGLTSPHPSLPSTVPCLFAGDDPRVDQHSGMP